MDRKSNPYVERIDVDNSASGISHFKRVFKKCAEFGAHTPQDRYFEGVDCYMIQDNSSEVDMSFSAHARKTRLKSDKYGLDSLSLEDSRVNYEKSGGSSVTSRFEMGEYTVESVLDEWFESGQFEQMVKLVEIHDGVSTRYAEEVTVLNMAIYLQGPVVETQITENIEKYVLAGESADIGGIDMYDLSGESRSDVQVKSWKDGYNNEHNIDYRALCWAWVGGDLVLSNCPYKLAEIVKNQTGIKLNEMHKYLTFRMM